MGRGKRRVQSEKLPPFVPLLWSLLNSKAYMCLTPSAAKALPYFIGKPKINIMSPEAYNTVFELSYKEARSYGFSTTTFSRIIIDLVDKGFIDPVEKGGLKGHRRSSNKFFLSVRYKRYDESDFVPDNWKTFVHDGAQR